MPTLPSRKKLIFRLLTSLTLLFALAGVIPLCDGVVTNASDLSSRLAFLSDWRLPALRSLVLMVTCAPICIFFGFVIGSHFADARTKMGPSSGLLLVPILLGGGVNTFIFKLFFADIIFISEALQNRSPVAFWGAIIIMYLWQYIPCVAFLCWLNCNQLPKGKRDFAVAHGLSFAERLADVYWPQCRNLLIYVFLLIAASCVAEYERSTLVFRASQGTSTEFFSHWLLKSYFSLSRIDPLIAAKTVLFYTGIFAAVCIPLAGLTASIGGRMTSTVLRAVAPKKVTCSKSHTLLYRLVLPALHLFVLLPFLPTIFRGLPYVINSGTTKCVIPIVIPALLAAVFSALLSVLARLGWPSLFASFNKTSLSLCLIVTVTGFFPPVALAFVGMWWLKIGQESGVVVGDLVIGLWWLLLGVAALPIFLPGYIATQFLVNSKELTFQSQNRATFLEILQASFLARLWPAYALFALFVYAFMWSEYPLTALFSGLSTQLCSPVLELAVRTEGKGANFNEAAGIILQMAIPLLACSLGFGLWMRKRTQLKGAL